MTFVLLYTFIIYPYVATWIFPSYTCVAEALQYIDNRILCGGIKIRRRGEKYSRDEVHLTSLHWLHRYFIIIILIIIIMTVNSRKWIAN